VYNANKRQKKREEMEAAKKVVEETKTAEEREAMGAELEAEREARLERSGCMELVISRKSVRGRRQRRKMMDERLGGYYHYPPMFGRALGQFW
jgi:hypothetical protein